MRSNEHSRDRPHFRATARPHSAAPPELVGFDEPLSRTSTTSLAPLPARSSTYRRHRIRRPPPPNVREIINQLVRSLRRVSGRKLALAVACFVAAAYFLAPRLFFTYSERAITNAPLVTLRPPFPGKVEMTARVGEKIDPDDTVAVVTNPDWDPSPILDVEQRLRAAQARVEASQKTISGLEKIRGKLNADYDTWHELIAKAADLYITQSKARLVAAQARFQAAQTNLARYDRLGRTDLVNLQRLTDIRRDYQVALDDMHAAEAEVGRAQQQRDAIQAGITIGENDRPPSLQRMDELDIRLATENANLAAAQLDVQMLQRQREERVRQRERETRMVVRSTVHGSIWRVFARPGEDVSPRSDLLSIVDCDHLGISAIFNQRHVEGVRPDRPVSVELVGLGKSLTGHIAWVNGYYRADDREAQAIAMKPDEDGSVMAWVVLDQPLPACWVGLKASVHLR